VAVAVAAAARVSSPWRVAGRKKLLVDVATVPNFEQVSRWPAPAP
jgi:hypothetical protein